MKNSMQTDVEEFMVACGQEVAKFPCIPTEDVENLRVSLMTEELLGADELIESMRNLDLTGIADGIADLLYVVLGTAAAYGIDAQAVFSEVHRSNMTKVGPDGKVIRREDGKILKPETFEPARVEAEVWRQIRLEVPGELPVIEGELVEE